MGITAFHAKYFAHDLTRRCASDSVEKLAAVLSDAQVGLNPHQIEAALFAFRNPFSHGRPNRPRSLRCAGVWCDLTTCRKNGNFSTYRVHVSTPSTYALPASHISQGCCIVVRYTLLWRE